MFAKRINNYYKTTCSHRRANVWWCFTWLCLRDAPFLCWFVKRHPSVLRTRQTWWRHQMETFSALLALCAENSPVPGEFPTQRPVTRSFDVFFDLRLNKRLSKQPWGWWFETPSWSWWRHRNDSHNFSKVLVTKRWCCFYISSIIANFVDSEERN